ncbi:hypothetical protein [Vreelandella alkaliphila]|uniref:Uncharacterized protein n=1 Tax=Vreelandella alkaliphila TaxID=272774 RepID=A0AAJ2S456_9GAMM|nr:hypothetical protein [Halomonas alkaliphila]MDX5979554.1 hypothetical protein [Halomonas alkaliphila]
MTLSMRERLALQKSVKQSLATLRGGRLGMRERLALHKQVKADMTKLGGQAEARAVPDDSAQYGEYLAWIQDVERTRAELEGDGFRREINADERLNDGEASRLLDAVQSRIAALSEPGLIDSASEEEAPAQIQVTLTAQAVRGDFNGLSLPEFIEQLKSAYSADEDLDGAKEAAIGYLEANQQELEAA